jgi:hypothetical protein
MRTRTMVTEAQPVSVGPPGLAAVKDPGPERARRSVRGAAELLSATVAALMVLASALGLLSDALLSDDPWAREALRAGDLVTLVLVAPVLLAALLMSRRGSARAQLVWPGALAYSVYNTAYYVFDARFNDLFLLHIALFSTSIFALVCTMASVDRDAIAEVVRPLRVARWIGRYLVVVGALQGGLWVGVLTRNIVTGKVLADIPVEGQHLVFALDLSLLVPSLIAAGVLLARRTTLGFLAGPVMAVMGALYTINLVTASVFQANADVVGVSAFPPEGILLSTTFMLASALLLVPRGARHTARDNAR